MALHAIIVGFHFRTLTRPEMDMLVHFTLFLILFSGKSFPAKMEMLVHFTLFMILFSRKSYFLQEEIQWLDKFLDKTKTELHLCQLPYLISHQLMSTWQDLQAPTSPIGKVGFASRGYDDTSCGPGAIRSSTCPLHCIGADKFITSCNWSEAGLLEQKLPVVISSFDFPP